MKPTERREFSALYQSRVKLYERKYYQPILSTIESQIEKILQILKEEGPQKALRELDYYIIDGNLAETLLSLYKDCGVFFIKWNNRQIKKSLQGLKSSYTTIQTKDGSIGQDPDWIARIQQYFQTHLLQDAILPVTQNLRESIRGILNNGVQNGFGYEKIASEIRGVPHWKALQVTRTEVAKAAAMARTISVNDMPFLLSKEWISAHDGRVRALHLFVDGEIVDEDQLFSNGMNGPCDQRGGAEQIVNCRCCLAFIPKRNKNGRLIPK